LLWRLKLAKRSSSSRSKTRSRRSSSPSTPSLQIKLTLDQKLDILGVALILGGILTLGSQLSFSQGSLTGPYLLFLAQLAGWGAYSVPLIMILCCASLIAYRAPRVNKWRGFACCMSPG
jgi:hypothetical protein